MRVMSYVMGVSLERVIPTLGQPQTPKMSWAVVMRQVRSVSFGCRGEFCVKRGVIAVTRYFRPEQGQYVCMGYTMGYMRRF